MVLYHRVTEHFVLGEERGSRDSVAEGFRISVVKIADASVIQQYPSGEPRKWVGDGGQRRLLGRVLKG